MFCLEYVDGYSVLDFGWSGVGWEAILLCSLAT